MFAQSGGSGWEDNVLMHGANRLPQGGDHDRYKMDSMSWEIHLTGEKRVSCELDLRFRG